MDNKDLYDIIWKKHSFSKYHLHSQLVKELSQDSEELTEIFLPSAQKDTDSIFDSNSEKVSKSNNINDIYYDCSQLFISSNKDNIEKEFGTQIVGETPLSFEASGNNAISKLSLIHI